MKITILSILAPIWVPVAIITIMSIAVISSFFVSAMFIKLVFNHFNYDND